MFKKPYYTLVFAFVVISFSSCIKQYTCLCTIEEPNYSSSSSNTFTVDKKSAEKLCDQEKKEFERHAHNSGATSSATCKLEAE